MWHSGYVKNIIRNNKSNGIIIAIGPEGDFTNKEIEAAKSVGFKAVSLGRRVLKSDTAGLAVLAILDYEFAK